MKRLDLLKSSFGLHGQTAERREERAAERRKEKVAECRKEKVVERREREAAEYRAAGEKARVRQKINRFFPAASDEGFKDGLYGSYPRPG